MEDYHALVEGVRSAFDTGRGSIGYVAMFGDMLRSNTCTPMCF